MRKSYRWMGREVTIEEDDIDLACLLLDDGAEPVKVLRELQRSGLDNIHAKRVLVLAQHGRS